MAEKRMFAKAFTDRDEFLAMPLSAQCLYFHLCMHGDDDGFVGCPRSTQRMVGSNDDDSKILIAKGLIIPFESGVWVIRHWRIHNYLRKDRYKPTLFVEEASQIVVKDNGEYERIAVGIPTVYQRLTAGSRRIDKSRIDQNRSDKSSIESEGFITDAEADALQSDLNDVFEAARYTGFACTQYEMDKLNLMVADYGKDAVMRAIGKAGDAGVAKLSYLYGILKNDPTGGTKPKPADKPKGKTVIEQQYEQRDYDPDIYNKLNDDEVIQALLCYPVDEDDDAIDATFLQVIKDYGYSKVMESSSRIHDKARDDRLRRLIEQYPEVTKEDK